MTLGELLALPEVQKKLAKQVVLQVGQKFHVIDPSAIGIHEFTQGTYKGQVMPRIKVIATVDEKGNDFVPQVRGKRKSAK